MQYTYKTLFRAEPEGGFTVIVPVLPGCITWGENMAHAEEMAKEAIELYVESIVADGQPVPTEEGVVERFVTVSAA